MRRIFYPMLALLVCCAAVSASGVSVGAERRVALVIGNDSYKALPNLRNARTDARGMARKLKSLGFEVILQLNVSRRGMYRAISKFERRLNAGATGLAFFAGHGIQADGRNYLIPADARVEVEDDLPSEAITAEQILAAMTRAGNPLNILILDACRDNPLPRRRRSTGRGLTVVGIPQGAKGTAILYAAAPGQSAQDGPKGGHGLFTGELLQVLDQPGLKLEEVFKQVNARVYEKSNGRQTPWSLATLRGDFYFKRGSAQAANRTAPTGGNNEGLLWQSVRNSDDPDMVQIYLDRFPDGIFAPVARLKLKKMRAVKSLASANSGNTAKKTAPALSAGNSNDMATKIARLPPSSTAGGGTDTLAQNPFDGGYGAIETACRNGTMEWHMQVKAGKLSGRAHYKIAGNHEVFAFNGSLSGSAGLIRADSFKNDRGLNLSGILTGKIDGLCGEVALSKAAFDKTKATAPVFQRSQVVANLPQLTAADLLGRWSTSCFNQFARAIVITKDKLEFWNGLQLREDWSISEAEIAGSRAVLPVGFFSGARLTFERAGRRSLLLSKHNLKISDNDDSENVANRNLRFIRPGALLDRCAG